MANRLAPTDPLFWNPGTTTRVRSCYLSSDADWFTSSVRTQPVGDLIKYQRTCDLIFFFIFSCKPPLLVVSCREKQMSCSFHSRVFLTLVTHTRVIRLKSSDDDDESDVGHSILCFDG